MPNVKLLDCTLRDGGYVNDWRWGFAPARQIIRTLTRAGTDIVEVGFLRNVGEYDPDVTVCNTIEELNRLLPEDSRGTMYSGMAMRSNYDISKLSEYSGRGIEMIRITAHDYDIRDGMDFAREVKARGYKLSINPINIMGYADKDILWILDQVKRHPALPVFHRGHLWQHAAAGSGAHRQPGGPQPRPRHPGGPAPAREHGAELLPGAGVYRQAPAAGHHRGRQPDGHGAHPRQPAHRAGGRLYERYPGRPLRHRRADGRHPGLHRPPSRARPSGATPRPISCRRGTTCTATMPSIIWPRAI